MTRMSGTKLVHCCLPTPALPAGTAEGVGGKKLSRLLYIGQPHILQALFKVCSHNAVIMCSLNPISALLPIASLTSPATRVYSPDGPSTGTPTLTGRAF